MKSLLLLAAGLLAGVAITLFLWPVAPLPLAGAPAVPAAATAADPVTSPATSPATSLADRVPVAATLTSPPAPTAPGGTPLAPASSTPAPALAVPAPLSPPTASRLASAPDSHTPLSRAREVIQRRAEAAARANVAPATTLRVTTAATTSRAGPIVDLRIPADSTLPLALTEDGQGLTGAQLSAVDASAAAFVEQLQSTARKTLAGQPVSPRKLLEARQLSDEQYRTLFGYTAADQAAVRNAPPQAQSAPTPPATAP